jgi:multiple sugar transport system substrate-binding protein
MSTKSTGRGGLTRRDFIHLAGLGGAATLLPGCFSTGGSTRDGGDSTPGGKVNLTFWLPGGEDAYLKVHEQLAKDYTADHPNVGVKVTRLTGEQNFLEVLLSRIAGGNPPSATVIWDTPVALGIRGSLMPLDEYMANSENSKVEQWPEAVLKSCQADGKTYGLPFTAGSYGMFYNQEWFEEKGIPGDSASFPKTLVELRALSKEFTVWKGDRLETAGFIPSFDPNVFPLWAALNGGGVYDSENQRYTLDAEQNVELLDFLVSWLDEEYKGSITKVDNSFASLGEFPPTFQQKRVAMLMEGTWMIGSFYQVEAKFERWEVAPNPTGPSGTETTSGYWPNWMAIPTASNNPEEAFEYLDYIAVDGAVAQFEEFPDLPTNAKVPANIVPKRLVEKRGQEFAEKTIGFFRDQLKNSTPMWDSPVQTFAVDQLTRVLERVSNKVAKPKDALAEAQRACQGELEKVL